jgi:hypothetical protein
LRNCARVSRTALLPSVMMFSECREREQPDPLLSWL